MVNETIRLATLEDAEAILGIYKPYIENTAITFEYEVPYIEEFRGRIEKTLENYPYLVYVVDGRIIGYAYASRHRERAAYGWNVELSIYLDQNHVAKGVGSRLYHTLIEVLKVQNIHNVYGCITPPNTKSEGLHKRLGFHQCGVFKETGYKFGKWHDVVWFEKCIGDKSNEPKSFIPVQSIEPQVLDIILQNGIKK